MVVGMARADHTRYNTTSGYTVAETFQMLPEKRSADLPLLNYESGRRAIVIPIERNALDAN